MLYAASHLGAVAALFFLFHATGYLLAHHLPLLGRVRFAPPLWRTVLGLVAWCYVSFALCALHLFRRPVLFVVALLLLALAGLAYRRRARAERPAPDGAARDRAWLLAIPLALAGLQITIGALLPLNVGYDALVYHMVIAKRYVEAGGFRPIPYLVYANWPHNVELLYGAGMAMFDFMVGKMIHFGLYLLLVASIFEWARRRASVVVALLAVTLFADNPVLFWEPTTGYIDVGFALFFFYAFVLADEYLETKEPAALLAAGIMLGALGGTKLSGFFGCVGVGLVVGWSWVRTRAFSLPRAALLLGIPCALLVAPWLVKNALYTGNPVYPMLYGLFGGIEWNAQLQQELMRWHGSFGMGHGLVDTLLLPFRVLVGDPDRFAGGEENIAAYWVVLAPLAVLASVRVRALRAPLVCALGYFLCWSRSSQQARFLLSVVPLLAVSGAGALEWLFSALRSSRRIQLALVAVTLGFQADLWRQFAPKTGDLLSMLPYFRYGLDAAIPYATAEHYKFLNAKTPKQARVLLLKMNDGFFLDREYVADSFFEASQLRSLFLEAGSKRGVEALLARMGIRYVAVGKEVEADVPLVFPPYVDEYLKELPVVYESPEHEATVYEVPGPEAQKGPT